MGGSTGKSRPFPEAGRLLTVVGSGSTAGRTRAIGSTAGSTGTTAGTQKISDLRSESDFARFWAEKGDGKSQIEGGNDGIKPWNAKEGRSTSLATDLWIKTYQNAQNF